MKTLLKLAGGFVAFIILAVAVLYVGWAMPPDKEDVCKNMVSLTAEDASEEFMASEAGKSAMKECVAGLKKGSREGAMPYAKRLKCARDAKSREELADC